MRCRTRHLYSALIAGAAASTISLIVASSAQAADAPAQITSVVELYTSQGCSSCPPADALLKSYISRPGTLALSFNVDIWDNLGWKDTLASAKYTQRQRAYARTRGDGQVYTPQMIINGSAHAVGSDRSEIDTAIRTTSSAPTTLRVALAVTADGDGLTIAAPTRAWAPPPRPQLPPHIVAPARSFVPPPQPVPAPRIAAPIRSFAPPPQSASGAHVAAAAHSAPPTALARPIGNAAALHGPIPRPARQATNKDIRTQ